MPQHARNTRVCRDCDGFASVAITTGTRATIRITCPACKGTGRTTPVPVLARTER
ncbi:hypothetical protein [Streptomyces sp. NPDC004065]|uniref:hypothetical protein n=1 Tax=Streptomyces sp. NPDC004065 TaxID=3364689 RepID=UPI00384C5E38